YKDDFEGPLTEQIGLIFRDEAVRNQLYHHVRLSGSSSLLKRVADELARPIYAQPPRRVVTIGDKREADPHCQEAYSELADETCLDGCMDLAARYLVACTSVFLVARVLPNMKLGADLSPYCEVLTPDVVSVIAHPKAKTVSVA